MLYHLFTTLREMYDPARTPGRSTPVSYAADRNEAFD